MSSYNIMFHMTPSPRPNDYSAAAQFHLHYNLGKASPSSKKMSSYLIGYNDELMLEISAPCTDNKILNLTPIAEEVVAHFF